MGNPWNGPGDKAIEIYLSHLSNFVFSMHGSDYAYCRFVIDCLDKPSELHALLFFSLSFSSFLSTVPRPNLFIYFSPVHINVHQESCLWLVEYVNGVIQTVNLELAVNVKDEGKAFIVSVHVLWLTISK